MYTGLVRDWTDEQIAAEVRDVWSGLAPYFEIIGKRAACDVDQIRANLRAELVAVSAPGAIVSCALPVDVAAFHRLVESTVISQRLGGWDLELFGRDAHDGPPLDPDEDQRAAMLEHGLWHILGRYNDKHELWVCVDGGRPECGQVLDFNDGSPLLPGPLVPDATYPSWLAFLRRLSARAAGA